MTLHGTASASSRLDEYEKGKMGKKRCTANADRGVVSAIKHASSEATAIRFDRQKVRV